MQRRREGWGRGKVAGRQRRGEKKEEEGKGKCRLTKCPVPKMILETERAK